MTPQELADDLIGTANFCTPDEELHGEGDLQEFDMLAFECDCCGWWCSADELNNEGERNLCDDCHTDEHGDEDDA
jgi:hypothetical protein